MDYHVLISETHDPGFNLAAESFLVDRKDEAILFLYVNNPSVIIGRNQSVEAEVEVSFCQAHQVAIRRRLSGGGAVYHDEGNLNICIVHSKESVGYPLQEDRFRPFSDFFQSLQLPVTEGKRHDFWLQEVKISGTASHIGRYRSLFHGTILYDCHLERMKKALKAFSPNYDQHGDQSDQLSSHGVSSVPSPVGNIRDYLQRNGRSAPSFDSFWKTALSFFLNQNHQSSPYRFSSEETAQIRLIQRNQFDRSDWIFKK
jgi:lipoate-protein ligase A